jgi:hypothetical protein
MPIHFTVVSAALGRDRVRALDGVSVQQIRRSLSLIVAVLTNTALTIAVVSILAVARLPVLRGIIEPPQGLLPGSSFPEAVSCPHRRCCTATPLTTWTRRFVCPIDHDGTRFDVTYDDISQKIVQTAISGQDYTLGDLISAWGTPTGIAQYGWAIDAHWETQYASLITCSIQPDSAVKLIAYSRERHWATTWRGFTNHQADECGPLLPPGG